MSRFADFIRNATPEEKAQVYAEVMSRAAERQAQLQALPSNAIRVAPGSDAVVWKTSPEHSGEL